jgi:hypothetical protein
LRRRNRLRQLAPGVRLGLFDPGELIAQRLQTLFDIHPTRAALTLQCLDICP